MPRPPVPTAPARRCQPDAASQTPPARRCQTHCGSRLCVWRPAVAAASPVQQAEMGVGSERSAAAVWPYPLAFATVSCQRPCQRAAACRGHSTNAPCATVGAGWAGGVGVGLADRVGGLVRAALGLQLDQGPARTVRPQLTQCHTHSAPWQPWPSPPWPPPAERLGAQGPGPVGRHASGERRRRRRSCPTSLAATATRRCRPVALRLQRSFKGCVLSPCSRLFHSQLRAAGRGTCWLDPCAGWSADTRLHDLATRAGRGRLGPARSRCIAAHHRNGYQNQPVAAGPQKTHPAVRE